MTWIRFDDQVDDHPKITGLSDAAFRWWFRSVCYSNRFLLDGLLPPAFLARVPKKARAEIVSASLWDDAHGVVAIHDYHEYQPTSETVKAKRQQTADRVKRFRKRVTSEVVTHEIREVKRDGNDAPNPTQPIPTQSTAVAVGARGGLLVSPLAFDRMHGQHAPGFCDWVCLPQQLVAEFAAKSGRPDDAESFVLAWAGQARAEWEGQPIGDDCWRFWRSRWLQTMGSTKPVEDGAAGRQHRTQANVAKFVEGA